MPICRCFALDLKNDPEVIARYKAWHEPCAVPAAVTQSIRESGIRSMEIYLIGNRLFMITEVDDHFSDAAAGSSAAQNPDVLAWEALMWTLQQPLPWARLGEKWVEAERIYSLNCQPAATDGPSEAEPGLRP